MKGTEAQLKKIKGPTVSDYAVLTVGKLIL